MEGGLDVPTIYWHFFCRFFLCTVEKARACLRKNLPNSACRGVPAPRSWQKFKAEGTNGEKGWTLESLGAVQQRTARYAYNLYVDIYGNAGCVYLEIIIILSGGKLSCSVYMQ